MTRKLLIVDDAVIVRKIISDVATAAGWLVVGEAANGQEAIDAYRQFHPDAVTLDLVMPQFDGLHGLRGILAMDPAARVIVVSALDQKSILKEAFKAGAADFVVKPFDQHNLLNTLDQLVPDVETAGADA
jgi:two-component system chemotaxis response regulator CheY